MTALVSHSDSSANANFSSSPCHNFQMISQTVAFSSGPPPFVNVKGKTDPAMAPYICAKCNKQIIDRYLLEAMGKYWHEDCLKCEVCDGRLGQLGCKLYSKNNSILCQRDYFRIFGPNGICAVCSNTIPPFEQVMRAGNNVYHLQCFACQQCKHRFCIGDKFYLDMANNKILCQYDYEEMLVFAETGQHRASR